ncbi:uncharacterized protein LOC131883484 [Tigriopus californicus]|nr:uncharacterized protein LOC131883484 [Tigriopus californicus]
MTEEKCFFRVALPTDETRIFDFCDRHFFQHEPMCQFLALSESKSWTDQYLRSEFHHFGVMPCLDEPFSILAVTPQDDILGVMLGKIWTRDNATKSQTLDLQIIQYLSWLLPRKMVDATNLIQFSEVKCGFNPVDLLNDLGSETLFIGELLCVSQQYRGQGLGQKLLSKSVALAQEQNCDSYASLATAIYSQRIFLSSGFSCKTEEAYQECTSLRASPNFEVFRPHTSAKVCCMSLI